MTETAQRGPGRGGQGRGGQGQAGQGRLAQLIATRGGKAAPEAPFVIEHREALIYMLCEAAELEHGIMCQYLFAAFSLKQRADEGLTEAELEVVTEWRKHIAHVATQEMLHLALVHNIMTAIGGAPHLARQNMPAPAAHYPAGVQLVLLPFGEQALQHFMFLERPEGMDIADAAGMTAMERAEPMMAEGDIVPRLQDFATVGHLYRSIEVGLARLAEKFGEQWLFIGPPKAQATSANFRWPELIPVTDLASACRAVGEILEQGEGPRGHWENAHFGQFVKILDEYQQMKAANPDFDPVRPVMAANVRPIEHADVPLVTDPLTAETMDLFNVGYEVLLLALERYFAHTEETAEQLATLADVTLGLMFSVLKPLGDLVTQMPVGPSHPGFTAAPSFELFYESDYLMPHRAAAWALLEERMREASAFASRCRTGRAAPSPFVADALGKVGEAYDQLADQLAAHFPDWGLVSRWASPSPDGGGTQAGVDEARARASGYVAQAADGPFAHLAADAYSLLSAPDRTAQVVLRIADSVLRPLAASAASSPVPVDGTFTGAGSGERHIDRDEPASDLPLPARLRELALAAAGLRLTHSDPALMEASAALQDLALRHAVDANKLLSELDAIYDSLTPGITVAADGPYLVTGDVPLRNWLGEDLPARPQLALCRCGETAIKPLCDGACARTGFSGAKDPKRVPDHRDTYPGPQLTVFDNRGICQHSGYCTDRLSAVFHAGSDPFVTPGGARADEIITAVRSCPSGALSVAIDGVEERAIVDFHDTRPAAIEVSKDGPYRITGGLPLTDAAGAEVPRAEGSSREHYALCRCGHSQNKPFCSGMHWYVGFTDPAPSARPTLFEWAGGLPALTALTRLFYAKHLPADPVLGPLCATLGEGQPERAAARIAEAFGGAAVSGRGAVSGGGEFSGGGTVSGEGALRNDPVPDAEHARWTMLWLRCADEARLPADPEFRSAFAAYVAWEAAAPADAPAPQWDWGAAGMPRPAKAASSADTSDEVVLPAEGEPVSFARHIKPLFREKDRTSMSFAFDLWSYGDVRTNAAGILDRVNAGTMPCDGTWPAEKVAVFRRWTESGTPE
jgi:CDGSH-type Zn-finger protein/truncated hemoglobin YjbI